MVSSAIDRNYHEGEWYSDTADEEVSGDDDAIEYLDGVAPSALEE